MFSSHKSNHKSSKSSKSSRGHTSTRREMNAYISFIFIVNELETNEEPAEGGVPPQNGAFWTPPTDPNAYNLRHIGRVYRWRNGEVEELRNYQWRNWPTERMATEGARGVVIHPTESMLILYRSATVFYSNRFTHFTTARGDATVRDTYAADPEDQWQRLTFHSSGDGNPIVSYVSHAGDYDHLLAPGRHLVPQLLPEAYDYQTNYEAVADGSEYDLSESATGLSGDLAILVALVAFSCRRSELHTVLTADRAWRNGRWSGHRHRLGRQERRGVVVSVYLDPDNETGSNLDVLNLMEYGDIPVFRAGH